MNKDNDQCTNNQLNKEKDRMDCLYRSLFGYCLFIWSLEFGHWSLSFILTSSISHVIKPHYDERSDKQLVVVAEIVGVRP